MAESPKETLTLQNYLSVVQAHPKFNEACHTFREIVSEFLNYTIEKRKLIPNDEYESNTEDECSSVFSKQIFDNPFFFLKVFSSVYEDASWTLEINTIGFDEDENVNPELELTRLKNRDISIQAMKHWIQEETKNATSQHVQPIPERNSILYAFGDNIEIKYQMNKGIVIYFLPF